MRSAVPALQAVFLAAVVAPTFIGAPPTVRAQSAAPAPAVEFSEVETREWLTYLASDALQGREVFTEGYGLAASYVAGHLGRWGVAPLGDEGSYLQVVREHGYRVTSQSSMTVEVGGQSRTFADGTHVTFPLRSGGRQTLKFERVSIVACDTEPPRAQRAIGAAPDAGGDGTLVVCFPTGGRSPAARAGYARRLAGAGAVIGFVPATEEAESEGAGASSRSANGSAADLTTVERVDRLKPPDLLADEEVFDLLLQASEEPLSVWRERAEAGQAISRVDLPGVSVIVDINHTYEVVSTRFTENVVGMVRGTDPGLANTYVFFGAHLDHVGYAEGDEAKGRTTAPVTEDRIWNGADDDGSGSVGLLAIAKAFAYGPKPRRSLVFVWHAGEEAGLLGSRYMVDFPVVPIDAIQAELNLDMIGRDRDNKDSEANTLYVVGADRISTDLHNLLIDTNAASPRPFTLDFEFNDAEDRNSFYTRSDHYSYARQGIPVAFFFTGTHPDYHANSDSVEKIIFPKLVRVTELVYRLGFALADAPQPLERDFLGPRSGDGSGGRLEK